MLRRFITLPGAFMIFAIIVPANAQQYQLRHYGVAEGLAHGAVHSIYQDRKGYIWFSTREGLSKFDGYAFVNFGERDGLGQQFINSVTEDNQGRMWVGTNGAGVALFLDDLQVRSGGKFKTFLVNKDEGAKLANAVNRILCDSRNNLWALTDGGLYRASLSDPNLRFEAVKTDPLS